MDVSEKLVELPIEDALLVLREEHRQRTDSYTTYLAHGGKGDPAEEVGLDALAIAISALEKTKWISVKDRLPETDGIYIVCDCRLNGNQWIHTDGFRKASSSWCELHGMYYDDVYGRYSEQDKITHWMQMPLAPEVKND